MKNSKKPFLSMTRYGLTKKHYTEEQAKESLEGGYILNRFTREWTEVPDPDVLSEKELKKRQKFCRNQNTSRVRAARQAVNDYYNMKYGSGYYTPLQIKTQENEWMRLKMPRPLISPI